MSTTRENSPAARENGGDLPGQQRAVVQERFGPPDSLRVV